MHKNKLRHELKGLGSKSELMYKLWDTVLIWSGYEDFYTQEEIAEKLGIARSTVQQRLAKFKQEFPEQYEKLKKDRESIKRAASRLNKSLSDPTSYDPAMDRFVKEKF